MHRVKEAPLIPAPAVLHPRTQELLQSIRCLPTAVGRPDARSLAAVSKRERSQCQVITPIIPNDAYCQALPWLRGLAHTGRLCWAR